MTIIFCDNCGKPITSGMIIGLRGQNGYVDLCEKCTKLNLDINKCCQGNIFPNKLK